VGRNGHPEKGSCYQVDPYVTYPAKAASPKWVTPQDFLTKYENFFACRMPNWHLTAIHLLLGPPNGMVRVMKTPMRLCDICIIGIIS
jgi:hypothetical protein